MASSRWGCRAHLGRPLRQWHLRRPLLLLTMSLPKHYDVGLLEFPGSSTHVRIAVVPAGLTYNCRLCTCQ